MSARNDAMRSEDLDDGPVDGALSDSCGARDAVSAVSWGDMGIKH